MYLYKMLTYHCAVVFFLIKRLKLTIAGYSLHTLENHDLIKFTTFSKMFYNIT